MKPSTEASYRERVLRTLVLIERDVDRDVALESLAATACLSPFHFHRVFAATVGETPAQYVRRLRLERAAHDLRASARPARAIARAAGYAAYEAFSRAFRARFGRSPQQYRRDPGAPVPPPLAGGPPAPAGPPTGRVERIPPLRVAFVRHVGPYEDVPMAFERLARWAGASALVRHHGSREPLFIGVPHDDPSITPPERLRFDCCVAVDDRVAPDGEVGIQVVCGGTYAGAVHRGPLERLGDTYAWLARELVPRERLRMRRAPFVELYLTSPERTAPDELLTEVFLPVHGRGGPASRE